MALWVLFEARQDVFSSRPQTDAGSLLIKTIRSLCAVDFPLSWCWEGLETSSAEEAGVWGAWALTKQHTHLRRCFTWSLQTPDNWQAGNTNTHQQEEWDVCFSFCGALLLEVWCLLSGQRFSEHQCCNPSLLLYRCFFCQVKLASGQPAALTGSTGKSVNAELEELCSGWNKNKKQSSTNIKT